MSNKLIIIEGPDNTGKTALAMQLAKAFRSTADVLLMHCIKPSTRLKNPDALLDFQRTTFMNQAIKIVKMCDNSSTDNVVIMDRAWYGEYVYGQIYRNENPYQIIEMINEIDDYLYSFNIKRATFLTNASPEFVLSKDDKKSFFSSIDAEKKLEAIGKEIDMFKTCFKHTLLSNHRLETTYKILDVEKDMQFIKPNLLLQTTLDFIENNAR